MKIRNIVLGVAAFFILIGFCHAENKLDGTLWLKNNNPSGSKAYRGFSDGHMYTDTTESDNATPIWTKLTYPYVEAETQNGSYNFMSYSDKRHIPLLRGFVDLSSLCFFGLCDIDNSSATICTYEEDHYSLLGTIRRSSCAQYTLQQTDWEPDSVDRFSRYALIPAASVLGQNFVCMFDKPQKGFIWQFGGSGELYEKAKTTDNGSYETTDVLAGTWSRKGNNVTMLFNDSYKAENNIALLTGGHPVNALLGIFKIMQMTGFTFEEGRFFNCDCTRVRNMENFLSKH